MFLPVGSSILLFRGLPVLLVLAGVEELFELRPSSAPKKVREKLSENACANIAVTVKNKSPVFFCNGATDV